MQRASMAAFFQRIALTHQFISTSSVFEFQPATFGRYDFTGIKN